MANLNWAGPAISASSGDVVLCTNGSTWSTVYDQSLVTTISGGNYFSSSGNWTLSAGTTATALTRARAQEVIDNVMEELKRINQKYHIWDSAFTGCDVLAAKMILAQLPKNTGELGASSVACGRRIFVIAKIFENGEYKEYVIDLFAAQRGGLVIQPSAETLPEQWVAELRYKSPASLIKRLAKEGRPSKELVLKDAIALSTRYDVSSISPTQMDAHIINPDDAEGRKFLEKFSKEVGFKTTLAQLLLDKDPIVAEKAKIIAQLILQR